MKLFIGIDLGTSAVKLSLVDEKGGICREVSRALLPAAGLVGTGSGRMVGCLR